MQNHTKNHNLKKKGGAWAQAAMMAAPLAVSLGRKAIRAIRGARRQGQGLKMKKKRRGGAVVLTDSINRGPIA